MPGVNRRRFLASAALAAGQLARAREKDRPNVLFVLADQWRHSAFGFGSDAVVRTPHFDLLARQGANWQRAYASNPVCTPNRACILTGRYSHQTGMIRNDLQLPPAEVCWPELFRSAGYATHYVGKWHLDGTEKPGFVPKGWRRRGFETFEGFNRGHIYHKPWGFDDNGEPFLDAEQARSDPYYEPAFQTDLAIDFMSRSREGPFACFLSWGPPHTPFRPPRSHDLYEPAEIVPRANVPAAHRERAMKELAGYYGLCESLDHQMGRIMSFLDEAGLADKTLVIFTSDHGELAGSHGMYRKGQPEDESLHVPLVMRLPGLIPAGAEPRTLTNSVDLMPTLLSLCGMPAQESCAGRDLSAAAMSEGAALDVESVYCEGKVSSSPDAPASENSPYQAPWRSIVTERYKLTVRSEFGNVQSLYDLQEDPLERRNLAGQPGLRGLQAELHRELQEWTDRTGDPFPARPPAAKALYPDPPA